MSIKYCHKHPGVITRIRCFHCKKNICSRCRLHLDHHFFCSRKCYQIYRLGKFGAFLRRHQLTLIVCWNVLLSLLLLVHWGKGEAPAAEAASAPAAEPPPAAVVRDALPLPTPIDTLAPPSADGSPALLARSVYHYTLPVERGAVVVIWQNDWPVSSERVLHGETKSYPIPLAYGRNRIRVGVWNETQQLVYQDYFEVSYRHPVREARRQPVLRGDPARRRVALTFDGGASDAGAREILAILEAKKVTATVFLTGQFVERYPDLVQQLLAAGHEVGNHTYNHPHLTTYAENGRHDLAPGVDRAYVQRQLLRTDSLFRALTGKAMVPYWRAAYGEYNQEIIDWAAEAGYQHIGWTRGFDTFDWVNDPAAPLYKTPQAVYAHILGKDNPQSDLNGAIVLMHLASERKNGDQLYTILPELIDDLHNRGFETVTVTRLLAPPE